MFWKVQRLPVRSSSTVRVPSFRPSSRRSWPSSPVSPMPSIHDSSAAMLSLGGRGSAARGGDWRDGAAAARFAGVMSCLRSADRRAAAATGTVAVAIGCLSAPAKTVTSPSRSMRTASSAPTRLRLSARMWPLSRLMPETRISAFGALATTVPSGSRTTMSRTRTAAPPFSVRSIWVPPTSTCSRLPKFSSIADTSQGVNASSWIGPLASRHHSPRQPSISSAGEQRRADRRRAGSGADAGRAAAGRRPDSGRRPSAHRDGPPRGCPGDADGRPIPVAGAPRFAYPGSSCPLGRPLVRGAVITILQPTG